MLYVFCFLSKEEKDLKQQKTFLFLNFDSIHCWFSNAMNLDIYHILFVAYLSWLIHTEQVVVSFNISWSYCSLMLWSVLMSML